MINSLQNNWREYLIEAGGLGVFMISACGFAVLFYHPASPLTGLSDLMRNVLMGAAMGVTAIGIITSKWGQRSGAHLNPAVTLTFFRLGKVRFWDMVFYIGAQFTGGAIGVLLVWMLLGSALADRKVHFIVTKPGEAGAAVAFAAEFAMSIVLMLVVLVSTNSISFARITPYLVGILVAAFITFESKYSGMSMNPARSLASAVVSNDWNGLWIYFIAPPAAMLTAAELYVRIRGANAVLCAKLLHGHFARCLFRCDYRDGNLNSGAIEASQRLKPRFNVLPNNRYHFAGDGQTIHRGNNRDNNL